MEQIDVAINLMSKYSDVFQLCTTADEVMEAIGNGKIASLMGLEGCVRPYGLRYRVTHS